uniref:Uncharacterized protein n=1 Tax=Mesocestoides corti TaxID=53468 RepID=A0A0R3UE16_MESCO
LGMELGVSMWEISPRHWRRLHLYRLTPQFFLRHELITDQVDHIPRGVSQYVPYKERKLYLDQDVAPDSLPPQPINGAGIQAKHTHLLLPVPALRPLLWPAYHTSDLNTGCVLSLSKCGRASTNQCSMRARACTCGAHTLIGAPGVRALVFPPSHHPLVSRIVSLVVLLVLSAFCNR